MNSVEIKIERELNKSYFELKKTLPSMGANGVHIRSILGVDLSILQHNLGFWHRIVLVRGWS